MTEPTEEEKQAVIAYFKEQGFELYKTEGINKLDAELIEARELLKTTREEFQWTWNQMGQRHIPDHFNRPANAINDIDIFLNKQQ